MAVPDRGTCFLDTGAFIALADRSDQHHQAAATFLEVLIHQRTALVTTDLVLAETYNWLLRRLGAGPAVRFAAAIQGNALLAIIGVQAEHQAAAWQIIEKYHDQNLSFTDATSFAVMQERRITDAFAFDRHFRLAGFRTQPL